ncbi:cyclin-like protein [Lentinula lateritia]|uniref:Cyclin-like protein n=1 Tax=Lentinula lateritia TaxID=40482 RepID=A0ABQ8VJ20_9AGAR|nr:cyclin-like protein [Lentinula lateritia]
MSSNIPVRRTTRGTKATKDSENANAKPSRIMTRARTQASSLLAENARATATTVASRAKTVETGGEKTSVKRKREILGEVTEPNSRKPKASAKGKEKAPSGDKAGPTATASKSRLTSKTTRAPLREVGGTASVQKPLRSKPVAGDRQILGIIKEDDDRDEVMIDETRAPAPLHATQPAIFKLVPQTSAHKDLLRRAPTSLRDDIDREPVFKKRITEDGEDRQPIARVTHRLPTTLDESQLEEDRIATELADVHEDEEGASLWDDLDADDAEDPFMAPEYVHEIMEYMKELEIRTAPTPDYMDYHSELDWEKRFILIEWILSIHSRYNFLAESFFLFVNVMDRFLSLRPTVALSKLQLVGVSCFCAAVKFEEGVAPSTDELVLLTGEIYSADEICKAERYVLKTIDWDLSFPGPMSWLRRGSKADDLDPVARTFAKYLLELACFAPELVATPSSLVAATSLWLARLTLGREEWTHNLIHYTSYKEREIIPVAEVLLSSVISPVQVEVLYKKYASRKFMKCSVYVRKWALARFEAGAEVDLIAELPGIKIEIVESRNAKIAAGAAPH